VQDFREVFLKVARFVSVVSQLYNIWEL